MLTCDYRFEAAPRPQAPRKPRLLVVEAEPLIRMALRDLLEDAGYEVLDAASAQEATGACGQQRVDLVFMDLHVPGARDGMALLDWLDVRYPGVPVFATSDGCGQHNGCARERLTILAKPYDFVEVVRRVGTALRPVA